MDVDGLNRDCSLDITTAKPEGPDGRDFVPDYWVRWTKSGETVALLEFLLPTLTVGELHVLDAKYILRKPVIVPNLRELILKNISSPLLLHTIGIAETNKDASTAQDELPR